MTKSATERRPTLWAYLLLAALTVPVFFYGLGDYSVVNGDEAHYHGVARHMVESGDWGRLEYTGEHRVYDTFMNAPIQYWGRALLISQFGDSFWTMRALSAAFACLSILLTYRLGCYVSSARAGFIAALVQLTTFQFVYLHSGRTGELEPLLCFVFTALCWTFVRALELKKSFLLHHGLLVVLANLKLPLVIVPILAELAFFALSKRHRKRFLGYAALGLLVPLGLAWHVIQYVGLDEDARQVLTRMGDQAAGQDAGARSGSGWSNLHFYLKSIAFGAFPWALAFPAALVGLLISDEEEVDRLRTKALVLYPAAVLAFFTIVAKNYPWYVVPAYPFLALWFGIWFDRVLRDRATRWFLGSSGVLAASLFCLDIVRVHPFSTRVLKNLLGDDGAGISVVGVGGLSPWIDLVGLSVLLGGGFLALYQLLGDAFARAVQIGLFCGLLLFGGYRVLMPLRDVEYTSGMELLARDLAERRAAGETLTFPIDVPESGNLRVRFYFGDEYRIVKTPERVRRESEVYFRLVGLGQTPGNPPKAGAGDGERRGRKRKTP